MCALLVIHQPLSIMAHLGTRASKQNAKLNTTPSMRRSSRHYAGHADELNKEQHKQCMHLSSADEKSSGFNTFKTHKYEFLKDIGI